MKKTIDLILPVYQPDNRFDQLMERIQRQTIQPNHIYLIHTIERGWEGVIKKKYGNVKNLTIYEIKKEDFDHGGTRNYGASLSKADYVMFMTEDAVPYDVHLVERILEGFTRGDIGVVYGRQLARKEDNIVEQYTRKFNYPDVDQLKYKKDLEILGIKTYFCSNVCAAYRRDIYEKLGGFVTKTIFNEDMIMASKIIKAGYGILYASEAKVIHSHHYTYRQQFSRNFDLGVSQKQYREIFEQVKSEKEGIRLVKQTIKYLIEQKKKRWIPTVILQSVFKYAGFGLGYRYEKLPKDWVIKFSMNKSYWIV